MSGRYRMGVPPLEEEHIAKRIIRRLRWARGLLGRDVGPGWPRLKSASLTNTEIEFLIKILREHLQKLQTKEKLGYIGELSRKRDNTEGRLANGENP